jgi:hypothetical protein
MCCFSQPVRAVSRTRIFSRRGDDGRQLLAYSMRVDADGPLAMVLPLPVPAGTPEDAVSFLDLSDHAGLFDQLEECFAPPSPHAWGMKSARPPPVPLEVVRVGAFVASFVPTAGDFERLDTRFRLPTGVFDAVPELAGAGFAVFQLDAGAQQVHPMGLAFPTTDPRRLFFPTLHVHDGEVHPRATFDHTLYLQRPVHRFGRADGWIESAGVARRDVATEASGGLVRRGRHVYRHQLSGSLPNRDTWA